MNVDVMQAAKIAVIGDVHLFWDDTDTDFFNESSYDLVLFVGDLAGYVQFRGIQLARTLRRLQVPAMCIPGNHDALHAFQLGAEVTPRAHRLRHVFTQGQTRRRKNLEDALGPVALLSYERRRMDVNGLALNLIAARPHSIGGKRLACIRYLDEAFGVGSMDASAERLKSLVDVCDDAPILFLAHNGPSGLGARANSIWGCDFRKKEEDWGDRDLEDAVRYARASGHRVLGAVAGHMHRRTKKGKARPLKVERDGMVFVNAAEVPRHREAEGRLKRHHVKLEITENGMTAEDEWIEV
jgi:uncharacterized protein (TIGR04168 family)